MRFAVHERNFRLPSAHKRFLDTISAIVAPPSCQCGLKPRQIEGAESSWFLDLGNKWTLSFQEGQHVTISYNDLNPTIVLQREAALASWLAASEIAYPLQNIFLAIDTQRIDPVAEFMGAKASLRVKNKKAKSALSNEIQPR